MSDIDHSGEPVRRAAADPEGEENDAGASGAGQGDPAATPAATPAADDDGDDDSDPREEAGQGGEADGSHEDPLTPPGNPPRLLRGGVTAVAGALFAFSIMAIERKFRLGVPLGILGVATAAFGVLDLLGSFDDPEERVARRTTLRDLARPLALLSGSFAAVLALVTLATAGYLPVLASALLIPAAFLALVVGVYRTGAALGAWDDAERPLLRRHGFWLTTATTWLYLPMLGSHSLTDPWETHYGEVAREILARNDWISLWWVQDGWFWSKPVLNFWMQSIAMAVFGVRYQPGQMLAAAGEGRAPWPEWAVRFPVFLLALAAVYLLYKGVSSVWGRRAGLLGGLVLLTMPQFFLISHQTMTDMPFVATMTSAMGLLLLGIHADPERVARVYEVQVGGLRLRFSAFHLVFGMVLLAALPQILYLLSRNVELHIGDRFGFRFHPDAFVSGSAQNCGLPGNEACRNHLPVIKNFEPATQAGVWLGVLGLALWVNWGERRVQRLYFLAAWFFAALSTLAKGPAGFALPMLCAFAYLAATRRWRDLLRLEVMSGLLIILAVALPWYVAMYARHGQPFTDRLIFHDMFKRAFTHVHDTNEGDDVSFRYFVWQLGYAFFPWTGLAAAGLAAWVRRPDDAEGGKGDVAVFLGMWFLFAFTLFAWMLTKFHHYILPALPPAAMLTGILLHEMLGRRPLLDSGLGASPAAGAAEGAPSLAARVGELARAARYPAMLAAGVALAVYGVFRFFPGALTGWRVPKSPLPPAMPALGAGCLALGVAAIVLAVRALERGAEQDPEEGASDAEGGAEAAALARHDSLMLGALAAAGAFVVAFVGRDLAIAREGQPQGQARLMHLFTYNYKRPWPDSLDFSAVLWAFAIAATVATALLAVARWRRHAVTAMVTTALLWAMWGLDVYLVKASPHWGQRETILRYFQHRTGPDDMLVAYQMNWKGENFYAGNRVATFVSTGKKFTDWMDEQKKKGQRAFYFVTEHHRTGSLQNELGATKRFEKVTTPDVNNKFVLVRADFE